MPPTEKTSFLEEALPEPGRQRFYARRTLSSSLLLVWLLVIVWLALSSPTRPTRTHTGSWIKAHHLSDMEEPIDESRHHTILDYGQYRWHENLNWDDKGRLIVIGDVHGQADYVQSLLNTLKYSNETDTLVFAGDLVAKHPKVSASLATINLVRRLQARSVRGNHDQYVIWWRSWMDANRERFLAEPQLLQQIEDSLEEDAAALDLTSQKLLPHPKGWRKNKFHFKIAKDMSDAQFDFLSSLPLSLYVDPIKTFVVHAGLLPHGAPHSGYVRPTEADDLEAEDDEPTEALAILPDRLESRNPAFFSPSSRVYASLEASKEKSVLLVEQNRDPYTLLEMRGVSKHGNPHRKQEGRDWHVLWNEAATKCAARHHKRQSTNQDDAEAEDDDRSEAADVAHAGRVSCAPTSIIYGHWKAQGLNIHDYTFGLDSGCVYGQQLSALVVGHSAPNDTDALTRDPNVEVRDVKINGRAAQVVSLACKAPAGL